MVEKKIPLNSLAGCKWWHINVNTTVAVENPSMELAADVYEETLSEFESLMRKDSEQQWLRKMVQTGTHADQVAALITLVQMSPVLSMPHLRQLLQLAQVKATRIIQPALTAIKRLLVEELLPSRKLVSFRKQDLSTPITRSQVLLFFFEDFLKKSFATFVQLLFDSQTSPIEAIRNSCVEFSFDLLVCVKGANNVGEQEKPLLKLLVKGLGDKAEKRVSAKACLLVRKLALKRPHMKEQIIDEVREQHFVWQKEVKRGKGRSVTELDYDRGMGLACSLFAGFPLNKQDDAFVASKLVGILSELVNRIITKKDERDKKKQLQTNSGLSECDARILRLCLKAMDTAFQAASSDCPIPETTNSLLIRLAHETSVPGLSVAVLSFLHRIAVELKTESPKLIRAAYALLGSIPVYLSNSLPWLLTLVKDAVLSDPYVKEEAKLAFCRRLVQVGCFVSDPVLPVLLALTSEQETEEEEITLETPTKYNPAFWDPTSCGACSGFAWESILLTHHYDAAVRSKGEIPSEAPSLSSMLIQVATAPLEGDEPKKKKPKLTVEDAPIKMPGMGMV